MTNTSFGRQRMELTIDVTELFRRGEFRKIAHICKAAKYTGKFKKKRGLGLYEKRKASL